jgi:nitroimidazol reductase NimA-like FMN-containing flavoprotein (pyridoxamine 5'-phosphate oxidase superfamily)
MSLRGTALHTDHHSLQPLTEQECRELLASRTLGRLGLSAKSLPYVVPVRYVFDGERILMRTGRDTSMAAATSGAVVAFQVDDIDERIGAGWSVQVQGLARELAEPLPSVGDLDRALGAWLGDSPAVCFSIPAAVISGQRLGSTLGGTGG